eukprot:jgi/Botrbrau1/23378/Bobra.0051s0029.1
MSHEEAPDGFVNGFSANLLRPEEDNAPPPPYESVVMNDTNYTPVGSYSGAGSSDFQVTIADPHKVGEGMKAHISYRVLTKTSLEQYTNKEPVVLRRFRDFSWLHSRLAEQNRGVILPPLPEKNAMEKYITHSASFVETRRRALQVYINRVAAHPLLRESRDLQNFLEATEEEWAGGMARAQSETSSGAKTLGNTLQLFRNVQRSAVNLVYSKSDDEEEDPDYIKAREYIFQLESQLVEVHKQAARFLKRQSELAASLLEFGASMQSLGKCESESLAASFLQLGEKVDLLAQQAQDQANELAATFEAPLKEFVQMVKSAKAVIADRATALSNLQAAKQDVDARRSKLTKLRGTPGNKEEKVSDVEKELHEAQRRAEQAKVVYENIVRRMSEELNRIQKERAADVHTVLRDFAAAQAKLAADSARTWRELLPPAQQANGAH